MSLQYKSMSGTLVSKEPDEDGRWRYVVRLDNEPNSLRVSTLLVDPSSTLNPGDRISIQGIVEIASDGETKELRAMHIDPE